LHPRAASHNTRVVLAVLPFENLTGDPSQDYFSDGLTEEMIAQLGRLDMDHLGVIARTSVMHYKRSQAPLEQIGRELGAQYALEGSVRRDVDDIRITAQLIQVKDQMHLWARQYDRQPSGLLTLQTEIAQEVADEILIVLGQPKRMPPGQLPPPSPNAYEAYDLYLKGRYFWNKRTQQGFEQAAEYFQQAIAKDPNYARAYAGLADTFALMSTWRQVPQNDYMPKARAAALKALQIDDSLAEAHASLALIAENYDYDWQTAEKEFRRAIQLDPSYATAHQWYAECLSFEGRFDEALAESERARLLDPLSLIIATDHGAILYYSRQYDRAIEQFRGVLEMEPNFSHAHMVISAYVQAGRFADALADIENEQRRLGSDSPYAWASQVYVYGRWGRRVEAQHALKKFEQSLRDFPGDQTGLLLTVYAGMNRSNEAIALLQKASSEHSNAVIALKVDPMYDPLRSDPRFQDLQHRVVP
jgi:TolB-like protein/Tfp pilus assembly protein PilF